MPKRLKVRAGPGLCALQFHFIGTIDLIALTTAVSDEYYNRVGISALFFD